ncbi:MAG: protein kinase domain-containing protein, partial [Anaerolineales bacterium]
QGQYLVMDYIEGEDLRQRMERAGNITEDEAILIGASICDALTYLHTRKPAILHRDLKPGNVKITPDGHIFLVDFGLAKVLHGSQATTTGARAMTPGYSPPEQYGTARTDPRTDIYSLGATLYAALSGIIPEDGLARAMDNTQLTPLRKRNGKVSRRFAAAVEKAMGIDPSDRYQNAEDFKRSLLGSKTKTQKLPGDFVVQPLPAEVLEEMRQSSLEKEANPAVDFKSMKSQDSSHEDELPVFKPRRKKRKGRRFVWALLWSLLLLSFAIVGVVRFRPDLVPSGMASALSRLKAIPIPFISSTRTPAPFPTPTVTLFPVEASTTAVTVGPPTAINTPTLVSTATIQPQGPTPTPDNTPIPVATFMGGGTGQIAFASARSGLPQIFLSNADGTTLTQLTTMENGACQPSWSPDGSQLVFISPCSRRAEFFETAYRESSLYLVNSDGTGQKSLTTVPGSDFEPAWSPDGKRIAFTSVRDGNKQIYVLDVNSLAVTRLTNANPDIESSQPAWSPDGKLITYMVKRVSTYQVWAMTDTGQENVQLARNGQALWDFLPVWSPDGKTIFFNQRWSNPTRPWLMKVNYEDLELEPTRLNFPVPIEDVELSPDGLWLVFEGRDNGTGNWDIYFMTIAGSGRTRLTTDPEVDFDPAWRPIQ